MVNAKCATCGVEMISTHTREGLTILLCPHIKTSTVKSISGMPLHAEVYCSLDVKGLRASFETLTQNSTLTIDALRNATKQTLTDAQLYEQANLALMLGLPVDELATLFECAFQLGLTTGTTPLKAIEALCKGVGRRSRLILDNIGIAFKATKAYNAFPQLNKTEAWQKYALKLIKEKAERLAK